MSFISKIQTLENKYALSKEDFNFKRRQLNMELLTSEEFDIVIVGGGIVGAAFANQISGRGLKVALLEASHFSSGTSSRSSKLIHGGLRYLEQLNFKLVFESLKERNLLLKHNAHLVKKLPFVFPLYKGDRVPRWKMSLGFWLYGCLSLFKMGKHIFLNKQAVLSKYPYLKSENLQGAFVYTDAQTDDVQLTWANLLNAHNQKAILSNYSEVTGIETNTLQVYDKLLDKNFSVKAKHVVLSLGPWTDVIGEKLFPHWKPLLSLSQGSHLYIKKEKLLCKEAMVISSNEDGRIIFITPQEDYILVGTTETPFNKGLDCVKAEEVDIQYLLNQVNLFFPDVQIERKDCVSYFSGVRPLMASTAKSNSKASRDHWIGLVSSNVSAIVGGKFTTHRKMAEDISKHVAKVNKTIDEKMKQNSKSATLVLPKFSYSKNLVMIATESLEKRMCFYLSDFFQYHISVNMRCKLTTDLILSVESLFKNKYLWSEKELKKQRQSLKKYFKDYGIKIQ